MKVIAFIGEKTIELVPRTFPDVESNLKVELRAEINNVVHLPSFGYSVTTNTLILTFEDDPIIFTKNMKYVLTIKDEDELIYIGKVICLEKTSKEDIQNFRRAEISQGKLKF